MLASYQDVVSRLVGLSGAETNPQADHVWQGATAGTGDSLQCRPVALSQDLMHEAHHDCVPWRLASLGGEWNG